ncbi:hypothetical protein [Blastococcus sp. PRF04-17]|uniref:hypothetical protein n=1 Tax=Blastococcus sp. PRF04-17 TaxID=2933797 RepID=UPI001FF4A602|nr:hypothetical protein [Blastococcus sp. PRF04-17]UOY01850.1 hypothetical protein MVA48_00215 [Blastococcus sp. PRF04-17]
MEVEAVGSVPAPRRPVEPAGVTAELARTRAKVREAAPAGRWDGVLAEVTRLQYDQGLSPLAALQAVYAKLASGWVPPIAR